MPQLMPLYWILSIFMVIFILFVMIDMFFYKNQLILFNFINMNDYNIYYLW